MIGCMELIALEAAETSRVAFSTIAELASAICEGHLDNWSQRMLKQARICLEVTGREHIEQDEDYIVVSNYQSRWDIPVLYQALRIPMQMMETNEIARIPSVAMMGGKRILPVTIDGTLRILSGDALDARGTNPVSVTISAPIDPASYGPQRIHHVIGIVQHAIEQHLPAASELTVLRA